MGDSAKPATLITAKGLSSRNMPAQLFKYRELIALLSWREFSLRYKQTVLGLLWAVIQPLAMMGILNVVLGRLSHMTTGGVPYQPVCLSGIVIWQLMSSITTKVSGSIVGNYQLVTKAFFPRLVIPLASSTVALIDFLVAAVVLAVVMSVSGVSFTWRALFAPLFVVMAFSMAFGAGLWMAALNVQYRDVKHVLPFVLQCLMFASPVVYPVSFLAGAYRYFVFLNPISGIVEGFRWSLLGVGDLPPRMLLVSIAGCLIVAASGLAYFQRKQLLFADRI